MMTENAKRLRRERKKRERMSADLEHKCTIGDCTASYPSANGLGQHKRRSHMVLGSARRPKCERATLPDTQRKFEKVREFAVRGDKIDSSTLWFELGERMFPRRSQASR